MQKKRALITGITGQDGSYLAELLLSKNYEVHGIVRRVSLEDPNQILSRIKHIKNKLILHPGSIESYSRIIEIFAEVKPNECYHLAAQSFVQESFEDKFSTLNININGTIHVLSALYKQAPKCKFYFAASSEMFGKVEEMPQTEKTKFHPCSPYGISKVTGFDLTRHYREAYNIFACNGILFNHESSRRGKNFVTRKITHSIANILTNNQKYLSLGNLNAKRDWGCAKDYVKAMWLMLQQNEADDYVIATGESHSIKEFLDEAFGLIGLDWKLLVKIDKKYFRPSDVNYLVGDYSKARKKLGWKPKVKFKDLVRIMLEADLKNMGLNIKTAKREARKLTEKIRNKLVN